MIKRDDGAGLAPPQFGPPVHDPLDEFDKHLAELRVVAEELRDERRLPSSIPVELVPNVARLREVYPRLQRATRTSMRGLIRPPDLTGDEVQTRLRLELMRAGVRTNAIYGANVLDNPEALQWVRRSVAAGERARVVAEVPMKLVIFDEACALIMDIAENSRGIHLIVYPSALLDGIIAMYDALWRIAIPIPSLSAANGSSPGRLDRDVLFLLAAGATDQAIARHLGVSDRTAHRRVRALMDSLGARTRFQAGIQAARRQLL
jgi:DNA-binding CsgD family transcriptional regulator